MRSIYALAISLALLATTTGLATAQPQPYQQMASQQQAIQTVIARGLAQRGVPFSYGGGDVSGPTRGTGPATNVLGMTPEGTLVGANPAVDVVGFDASGLMVYAFAGVGVKLPRSSGAQYKVGQKVTAAQALPGDLIFYGPEGNDSVALFIGNGQMLEVTDKGVAVSPVRTANMTPYLSRIIA